MKAPLYAPFPLVPAGRNQQRNCGIATRQARSSARSSTLTVVDGRP